MDDMTLAQMVDEIAEVLCKYLPHADVCNLRLETTQIEGKSYVQIFASSDHKSEIFSVSAELQHPPPEPSQLNLKCVTTKD